MSTQSFADLGVSRPVVDVLARRGITEPFSVQRLVLRDVIAGHDTLIKSPTGSGKTLAFGIPMVERLQADGARPAGLETQPMDTNPLRVLLIEDSPLLYNLYYTNLHNPAGTNSPTLYVLLSGGNPQQPLIMNSVNNATSWGGL